MVGDPLHPGQDDLLLTIDRWITNVQKQAPPFERFRQFTGVIGSQNDYGITGRLDRSQLRDRDLEVGQNLEQQGFGLHLDPVNLVNEEYDWFGGRDRLQQWPGEQERLAKDVVFDR